MCGDVLCAVWEAAFLGEVVVDDEAFVGCFD